MRISPASQPATGSTLKELLAQFSKGSLAWYAGQRTVEWAETDASGFIHNSAILRYAESSEAALFRSLQLPGLFGTTPRVQQLVNFHAPLKFEDLLTVAVKVSALGSTSMTLDFAVWRHEQESANALLAADGRVISVHIDPLTSLSSPWPTELRNMLASWSPSDANGLAQSDRAEPG